VVELTILHTTETRTSVQTFRLIPFPSPHIPAIEIKGRIARLANRLTLHYSVRGAIEDIRIPAVSTCPARKNELWKATCFEFFIALKDQPRYWEFNLSPSGDWNVYGIEAYRQVNTQGETGFQKLPFEFLRTGQALSLGIVVDLNEILPPAPVLQIGIATVIQTQDGNETHWALAHPGASGGVADFHLRDGFLIEL
jgi:hypothetical protein